MTTRPAESLLLPTLSNRRSRQSWAHTFSSEETWCDLTITLPCAVVLEEIHILPHVTNLASKSQGFFLMVFKKITYELIYLWVIKELWKLCCRLLIMNYSSIFHVKSDFIIIDKPIDLITKDICPLTISFLWSHLYEMIHFKFESDWRENSTLLTCDQYGCETFIWCKIEGNSIK